MVYRWAALAWMAVLALAAGEPYHRPELVWASLGAAVVWSAWLTVSGTQHEPVARWFDLALAAGLLLVSGLVVAPDQIGDRPFFAAAYPITAALVWGAAHGPAGGLGAGMVLGAAYVLARPLNGLPLDGLPEGGSRAWRTAPSTSSWPAARPAPPFGWRRARSSGASVGTRGQRWGDSWVAPYGFAVVLDIQRWWRYRVRRREQVH